MSIGSRRDFLVGSSSAALGMAAGLWHPARAAMRPDDKFDLVIKGGELLDPSQALRARRDIGIRYGLIEALEADIPASRAPYPCGAGHPRAGRACAERRCRLCRRSSTVERRFCKPLVGGSTPLAGLKSDTGRCPSG